jgi:ferredoxin/uncharacterized membrane protein
MIVIELLFMMTGAVVVGLLAMLAVSSVSEKKLRAAFIGTVLLFVFAAGWFGVYFWRSLPFVCMASSVGLVWILAALFFLPLGKRRMLKVGEIISKVDERDTAFAREEYLEGTDQNRQYYAAHPELKDIDDKIRALPPLLEEGGRYYNAAVSKEIKSIFNLIKSMTTRVDGDVNPARKPVEAEAITASVKRMMRILGADEVGVAKLNPMFVYSHVGRGPEPWGQETENNHKFVIAFTVEMDYERVETAPCLPTVLESAEKYLEAAQISVAVARYIRALGYPARAHISDSNYQIMLPPVARDAGLGELGRHGYLISPKFGSRIRLGAVTTDLPLVSDRPISFGVRDFCDKCLKCAVNCPPAAIEKGTTTDVRGAHKWPLEIMKCLHYWRVAGTDCGLCMKVCPFSHPSTLVHNLVRAGIKRSAFARTVSVWGDDLLYGRRHMPG